MNVALLLLLPALLAGAAASLLLLGWLPRATAALPGDLPVAPAALALLGAAWAAGALLAGRRARAAPAPSAAAGTWLAAAAVASAAAPRLLELLLPDAPPGSDLTRALLGGLPAAPAALALGGAQPWLARLRARAGVPAPRAAAGATAALGLGAAAAALGVAWSLPGGLPELLDGATALLAAAFLLVLLLRALPAAGAGGRSLDAVDADLARQAPAAAPPGARGLPTRLVCGLALGAAALPLLRLAATRGHDDPATRALLLAGASLAAALLAGVAALRRGDARAVDAAGPRAAAAALGAALGVLAALLLAPWWVSRLPAPALAGELLLEKHGLRAHAALVRGADGFERLFVDGRPTLARSPAGAALAQRMGRLSAALAPEARRAALLGVGRGHLLGGLAGTTPARVDAVEPRAAVLELGLVTPPLLGTDQPAPPVERVHADPRAWLARHPRSYDLVVAAPTDPARAGAGAELAREHFLAVRAALADDGVFVQWLPLDQLTWPAFAAVARAFLEAFPATRVVLAAPLAERPQLALVGGLHEGLPPSDHVDALLAATPCLPGPNTAGELHDLVLSDAWSLERALDAGPVNALSRPWSEWLVAGRATDPVEVAARNLRLLAQLAAPLATSSLRDVTLDDQARKLHARELQARSAALASLLHARAERLALRATAELGSNPEWRRDRERQLAARLLDGWLAFPGHLDLRRALLERADELVRDGRPDEAAALLGEALRVQGDGALGAALGGALIQLQRPADAVQVLRQAEALAPQDPALLLNLGQALTHAERFDEARAAFTRAGAALRPRPLPAPPAVALALLEGRRNARADAEQLLAALPAQHVWAHTLQVLLAREG